MKTQEELSAIKEEYENVSRKLQELTAEELAQVTGGDRDEKQFERKDKEWTKLHTNIATQIAP